MTERHQSVLDLDLATPLPEENHEIWSQQPDHGSTHVRNPKDLIIGNTYFLHIKGKGSEPDKIERFVLRLPILPSEVRPDTKLSMIINTSSGHRILAFKKLSKVGLMPDVTASYHRGETMGQHHFKWSENWIENHKLGKNNLR